MLPCEGQNPWPTPLLWALRGGTSEGGAPPPGREAGDRPAAPAETDVLSPPPEVCHLLPWLPGAASGVTVGAWLPREARWAGHGGPARPRPAPPGPAEPAAPRDPGPGPAPPPPGQLPVSPARPAARPRLCASRWAPPRVTTPPRSPRAATPPLATPRSPAPRSPAPRSRPRARAAGVLRSPLQAPPEGGAGEEAALLGSARGMPPAAWGECPSTGPHFSVAPTLPGGPAGSRAARLSERDSTAPVRSACFVGKK